MKKISIFLMTVMASFAVISCDFEEFESGESLDDIVEGNPVNARIISEKVLSPAELILQIFGIQTKAEDASITAARNEMSEILESRNDEIKITSDIHIPGWVFGYKLVNFEYESIDENGEPITLSALAAWSESDFLKKIYQKGIILHCPSTKTGADECASHNDGGLELAFMMNDELFIMPDYQGFGSSQDRTQMYLNHELGARQIYDALVGGYTIFHNSADFCMMKDWDLRIVGASQGGGNAVATQKYIENHDFNGRPLDEVWNLAYTYACAGPFSPVVTLDKYLEWGKLQAPMVLPLVLKSMLATNPDLKAKYEESQFFSALYNEHKEEFDKAYQDKSYDLATFLARMLECLKTVDDLIDPELGLMDVYIQRLLSEEMMNKESQMYKDLVKCTSKHDLTKGWEPKHHIYLYHGMGDKIVPYANSQAMVAAFPNKTTLENSVAIGDDHLTTCLKWVFSSWLKESE